MKKPAILMCALFVMVSLGTGVYGEEADPLESLSAGKKTFDSVCDNCHALDVPLSEILDRPQWEALVDEMVDGGAKLDADEKATVVDYLTVMSTFKTKCTVCHSKKRTTSVTKVREAWLSTVERMAAKKPDLFTEQEVGQIAGYLYLVFGAD
jgi:cytochrome c5